MKNIPAFPMHSQDEGRDIPGMTLRDYLAAHAPEVPEWFVHPSQPQTPRIGSCSDYEDRDAYTAAVNRTREEFDRAMSAWQSARLVAWRWHYADLMIEAREAA